MAPQAGRAGREPGHGGSTSCRICRWSSQDGARHAARPAGRVLVVTFLYTRCPLPDFCPLMVQHLEAVRRRANDAGMGGRLALLGVTLDPAFDTPAVLRAYGESVLKESNRFDQWTLATGTVAQVEDVARFFGIGYRAEGGLVTHTLTTAVIGGDGRVVRPVRDRIPGVPTMCTTSFGGTRRGHDCPVGGRASQPRRPRWESGIGAGSSSTAAIAAGSGLAGWHDLGLRGLLAQGPMPECRTRFSIPSRSAVLTPSR